MRAISSLLFLGLVACGGASINVNKVDSTSGPQCTTLCGQVGMTMDSLVIMAGQVGCVCRATPLAPGPSAGGAATAAGMAAILASEHSSTPSPQPQPQKKP